MIQELCSTAYTILYSHPLHIVNLENIKEKEPLKFIKGVPLLLM